MMEEGTQIPEKTQTTPCPGCGGPISYAPSLDAQMVVCPYCKLASAVVPEGLAPVGDTAPLAEMPSLFAMGKRGVLEGKAFVVAGRARYQYEDGFWDEWILYFPEDEKAMWVTEDEGEWVFFREKQVLQEHTDVGSWSAMSQAEVADKSFFVNERGACTPLGAEGQIFMIPAFGVSYEYADGTTQEGEEIVVMDMGQSTAVCLGHPIGFGEITWKET